MEAIDVRSGCVREGHRNDGRLGHAARAIRTWSAGFQFIRTSAQSSFFVLEGELVQAGRRMGPGWASVASAGSVDEDVHSETGCVCSCSWIVRESLATNPTLRPSGTLYQETCSPCLTTASSSSGFQSRRPRGSSWPSSPSGRVHGPRQSVELVIPAPGRAGQSSRSPSTPSATDRVRLSRRGVGPGGPGGRRAGPPVDPQDSQELSEDARVAWPQSTKRGASFGKERNGYCPLLAIVRREDDWPPPNGYSLTADRGSSDRRMAEASAARFLAIWTLQPRYDHARM
jgi:hypothetical protein